MAKNYSRLNVGHTVASSSNKTIKKFNPTPLGYKVLNYIESTGTQYIDTGFKPNTNTRVVTQLQCTQNLGEYVWIFGARTTSTTDSYGLRIVKSGLYNTLCGNANGVSFSNLGDTEILTIDMNKNVHTINNVQQSINVPTFQTAYNMILFGLNNGGSIAKHGHIRFYYFRIYDNDVLVRDFVPCINPNGEIGLYDLVEKKFYGNAGTGVFTKGE